VTTTTHVVTITTHAVTTTTHVVITTTHVVTATTHIVTTTIHVVNATTHIVTTKVHIITTTTHVVSIRTFTAADFDSFVMRHLEQRFWIGFKTTVQNQTDEVTLQIFSYYDVPSFHSHEDGSGCSKSTSKLHSLLNM